MYYVTESHYCGPNIRETGDERIIRIVTRCPVTNQGVERADGWLGNTNDVYECAHGEYETEAAARAAIAEMFGKCRDISHDEYGNDQREDGEVAILAEGEYETWDYDDTESWLCDGLEYEVTGQMTDEEIAELVNTYERDANAEGFSIRRWATEIIEKYIADHFCEDEDED